MAAMIEINAVGAILCFGAAFSTVRADWMISASGQSGHSLALLRGGQP